MTITNEAERKAYVRGVMDTLVSVKATPAVSETVCRELKVTSDELLEFYMPAVIHDLGSGAFHREEPPFVPGILG